MKFAALALVLAWPASAQPIPPDRIAERCNGLETIKVGAQPAKTAPYSLVFSADLSAGYYCYAECRQAQSFAIGDAKSNPIKIADLHTPQQTRLIRFDRNSSTLTDHQVIDLLGRVERNATATCHPAPFHEPPLPSRR